MRYDPHCALDDEPPTRRLRSHRSTSTASRAEPPLGLGWSTLAWSWIVPEPASVPGSGIALVSGQGGIRDAVTRCRHRFTVL